MIDHLSEHGGWTRQQAYAICSVAVDLEGRRAGRCAQLRGVGVLPLDVFG
jgi:acetamidase/formamidase